MKKIALLLAIILLLSSVATLADSWHEVYESAVEMIDDGRYGSAISVLNRVITMEPLPKAGKRKYGSLFIDYFPYYHLGLCHYETKNYSQAISWLGKSKADGEIKDDGDLYAKLNFMLTQARKTVTASNKNTNTATSTATVVTATQLTVTQTSVTQTLTATTTPVNTTAKIVKNALSSGEKYYNKGNYSSALREFNKAVKADSTNRTAKSWANKAKKGVDANKYVSSGRNLEKKGDYAAAIRMYERAIRNLPKDKSIVRLIRNAKAKNEKKLVNVKQKQIEDYTSRGFDALQKGNIVDAKINFERVLQIDPNNSRAKQKLREVEDRITARAGTDESKRDIQRYLDDAKNALKDRDLTRAKISYERAQALDSSSSNVTSFYSDLRTTTREKIKQGIKFYIAGDLEKSKTELLDAVSVYDSSAGLYAFLGLVCHTEYRLTGEKDDESLTSVNRYIRKVKELDPNFMLSTKIFNPKFVSHYSNVE